MNDLLYRIRRFLFQEYTPITKGIVVFTAVFFFINIIFGFLGLNQLLELNATKFFFLPWTLLTYPLVNLDFLTLFFGLIWLWSIGGNLERNFGSKTYSFFLAAVTITTGLAMVMMDRLFVGRNFVYNGIWLLLTGVTWAWARLYPNQDILLFGLIPMQSKWMAWLVAGLMFSSYLKEPLIGIASLAGIPVVYLFMNRGSSRMGGFNTRIRKQGKSFSDHNDNLKQKNRRSRLRVVK